MSIIYTSAVPSGFIDTDAYPSATVNTGASGAAVPLLNGANTWAAAQTFSVTPPSTARRHTTRRTWRSRTMRRSRRLAFQGP